MYTFSTSRFYIFLLLVLFISCAKEDSPDKTKDNLFSTRFVIAHRGCWDTSSPQNSLAAFKRALMLDIYGTEMDIRQTKDGLLVVNHDANYFGLSISSSTYEELNIQKLANGEDLPLFEHFLKAKKDIGGSVKLIIELKHCNVLDLVSLIDSYGLQQDVEYISFSTDFCDQLVRIGYGFKTFYLEGDLSPLVIKERGYGGIDYHSNYYNQNPSWIKESTDLGLRSIVWTVNDNNLICRFIQQGVQVTTDRPIEASDICNELIL